METKKDEEMTTIAVKKRIVRRMKRRALRTDESLGDIVEKAWQLLERGDSRERQQQSTER